MISIEFDGGKTKALLKRYKSRVRNLENPLKGWGNYMQQETERQFATETDPDGVRWAALAPSTLAEKRRKGYPESILTRTGKMRNSVLAIADARSILIGVDVPYAIFHQQGTRKMPQRRILGMNDKREQKLRKLIRVWIKAK
ncbi:MAG: phage virion morphogenesis protein [Symploca sp. SIO2G7]|nr:phage virion morphogenesis protein [Symploca sp. SIO2G7]